MAGERKLAATVHVDGTVYPAGASVPAEVAALITNPKAWGEEEAAGDGEQGRAPATPAAKSKGKGKTAKTADPAPPATEQPAGDSEGGSDDELVAPPRVGAGSGAEAWRTYALAAVAKAGLNIEIPEGTKRDEIVGALEDAGILTKSKE